MPLPGTRLHACATGQAQSHTKNDRAPSRDQQTLKHSAADVGPTIASECTRHCKRMQRSCLQSFKKVSGSVVRHECTGLLSRSRHSAAWSLAGWQTIAGQQRAWCAIPHARESRGCLTESESRPADHAPRSARHVPSLQAARIPQNHCGSPDHGAKCQCKYKLRGFR